ncbi:MAG: hypothetical protein LBE82_06980 [Chitinophagaceae bacterium]|jgi:hypothetical protein|nr:hypothetical protein [Chitinophagaceae bacterium]
MYRRLFIFLFYLFLTKALSAQVFGGNPSSIRWLQINTDTARVIFPQGLDSIAQHISTIIHNEQQHNFSTIGKKVKKINIVLQNSVTYSNGYVGLGPFRSEFYLMPSLSAFDLGAMPFADMLSVHEFRHVQQYNNFDVGLSKLGGTIFGEDGRAFFNAMAVPNWFFEGDAVYNETMLSPQGRGRLPQFLNSYKALFFAGKHYSYMQLRNGSYKNYIPDHYPLGYMLVAYGREKYGNDFWKNVTADAAAFKPFFYPFQNAVKKYSGKSFTTFTNDAFSFYENQWQQECDTTLNRLTHPEKRNVVNYKYPYSVNESAVLVLKNSFKEIPAFYTINTTGAQHKIAVRDIGRDDYFSYNNHRLVYSIYKPDVRWNYREYSDIRLLDLVTKKAQTITRRQKYFQPDISHNGQLIATVEYATNQRGALILLNKDGQLLRKLPAKAGHVFSFPKFTDDDNSLYAIERNEKGEMALEKFSLNLKTSSTVLPFANRIIGYPAVHGDTLFYTCSNNGKDEIWAYTATGNQHYRIANYATGLYQAAAVNTGNIISSAFTADGFMLAEIQPQWEKIENLLSDTLVPLYVSSPFQVLEKNFIDSTPQRIFPVKKYVKSYNLLNFHSIHPAFNDPNYSVILYGENVLNTLQTQLLYNYNRTEKYNQIGFSSVYGGWYVQPLVGVSQTFQRSGVYSGTAINWNELNIQGGVQLPLNFSGGKQYRFFTPSVTFNNNHVFWTHTPDSLTFLNRNVNYIDAEINFSSQIQQAVQQIYPRWAYAIFLQSRNTVNKYTAHQFLASGNIYLPALFKTNSLVVNGAVQFTDTLGNYSFSNYFPFSRGYNLYLFPRLYKLGVNYHFPVFYPDWGFGNIAFFNRIRGNLFYDYTLGKSLRTGSSYNFRTAGAELYFDTKWWNQQTVTFGIRYDRLLDNKQIGASPNRWEIIFPVGLFN